MMKNKHSIETQLTSGITYLRNHRLIENSNFWFGISWNYVVSISIVVKSVAKISSNDEKQTHNWETIDKLIIWDVIELVRSLAHCCRHQRKVLVENFEGHNSERNFQFDCRRYPIFKLLRKIDVIKLLFLRTEKCYIRL